MVQEALAESHQFLPDRLLSLRKVHGLLGVAQWLGTVRQSKRSPVQFPVRAHAFVAGWSPVEVCVRGN